MAVKKPLVIAGGEIQQLQSGDQIVTGVVPVSATYANPAGTTATAGKMCGLAATITPAVSGKVLILMQALARNSVAADGASVQLRYGTGAAPANGDPLTGTQLGANVGTAAGWVVNYQLPIVLIGILPGAVGTTYWIDLGQTVVTGGTMTLLNISSNFIEF